MIRKRIFTMLFLLTLIALVLIGCETAERTQDYYEACMMDPQCMNDMAIMKNATYTTVTATADAIPKTSRFAGVLGLTVSNIVAYVYGVSRGKKKMKGLKNVRN